MTAASVPQKSGASSSGPTQQAKKGELLGPSTAAITNAGFVFKETALGLMPAESEARGHPFIEEHGWHYGRVVLVPGGCCLWLDGAYGPVFEDFADAQIMDAGLVFEHAFSPNGMRLAYVGRQSGKMHLVIDGKPGPAEEGVNRLIFSVDSSHLACVVRRKGREHVLVDGLPGPACDAVCGPIDISRDGHRTAYVALTGKEYYLVVDQKECRDWPGTGWTVFSPNNRHIAYLTRKGAVVLDGSKGPDHPSNSSWGPVFSRDSQHVAYVVHGKPSGASAWIDSQPLPLPQGGASVQYVDFSPDLKRWACTINEGQCKRVFLEGQYGPIFQSAWGFKFSPDGARYTYFAETTNGWWMVVDGKVEAEVELNPSEACFSPNSKRLAYLAGRGPVWWMMVDGKAGPKFIGRKEQRRGLFGSLEEQVPALTGPVFSPDNAHVAYGGLNNHRWAVWVDHVRASTNYDEIVQGGPSFREDGTLEFLGIRDHVLYRVSAVRTDAANSAGRRN